MRSACRPSSSYCLERTHIINDIPSIGVLFSHAVAEPAHNHAARSQVTHEDLFREPQFAPDTTPRPADDEPAPTQQHDTTTTRPRRAPRHHRAA